MMRRHIPLALFACLLAEPSFAANSAPAQKSTPSEAAPCEGGGGISADAQIASCTQVIDATEISEASRAAALRVRCLLLSEKSRNGAAIADCDRAVMLDPKNVESYFTRGKAYRNAKEYKRAISDFSQALALKPHSPGILTLRGMVYYQKGDYDSSIADLSEAVKLWPNVGMPQSLLAQVKAAKARRDGERSARH